MFVLQKRKFLKTQDKPDDVDSAVFRRATPHSREFRDALRSLDVVRAGVEGHALRHALADLQRQRIPLRILRQNRKRQEPGAQDAAPGNRLRDLLEEKANAADRVAKSAATLDQTCRLYRALRLPTIPSQTGAILREADRQGILGRSLLVIGTNAMAAYSLETCGEIRAPFETEDFDVTWTSDAERSHSPFWTVLKAVDSTYAVNAERTFQARNAAAYEVELPVAPSRVKGLGKLEKPYPVPLPEQEWLLKGKTVSRVVVAKDGSPARLARPDPRWFALQKLWMSAQPKRNPFKRGKDEIQGMAVLDAVAETMPQFPLDAEFESGIPEELSAAFESWRARRPEPSQPTWR